MERQIYKQIHRYELQRAAITRSDVTMAALRISLAGMVTEQIDRVVAVQLIKRTSLLEVSDYQTTEIRRSLPVDVAD
jgi:hypothetical protein